MRKIFARTRHEVTPAESQWSDRYGSSPNIDSPSEYQSDGPGSFPDNLPRIKWEPKCCTATDAWLYIVWEGTISE